MKKRIFLLPIIILLLLSGGVYVARAEDGVTFAPTEVAIDFPNSITFDSRAVSADAGIVKAQFIYYLDRYGASDSTTRENIDIEPGKDVALYYQWDTHDSTIIPWAPIVYRWRVIDANGNRYESEPQRIEYKDTRFDWKERSGDNVTVLWHDKPDIFGDKVFAIAQKAIDRQRKLFGTNLAIPIRIIVYNNLGEFSDWHSVALDWVGGEAFPDFGVTTQIVTSKLPDSYWLNAVIPHEISHLYLYQAAYNPAAPVPVWLNEGIAQYNQFTDEGAESMVKRAARRGDLIPLTSLAAGFGQHDEARIRLSYAEGLSAVKYLVATYGEEGLARLMADYRKGLVTDDAFQDALGVSMGQFQQDWAEYVGAPAGSMITPTPWPLPTFPPTPTPMTFGDADAATPASPTQAPSPSPTSAAPASTATPPPTAAASTPIPPKDERQTPFCPGLFILLPIPLLAIFLRRT